MSASNKKVSVSVNDPKKLFHNIQVVSELYGRLTIRCDKCGCSKEYGVSIYFDELLSACMNLAVNHICET